MPRELRQRTKKPDYTTLSGNNSDEIADGDDGASSDDFVPTAPVERDSDGDDGLANVMDEDGDGDVQISSGPPVASSSKQKVTKKSKKSMDNSGEGPSPSDPLSRLGKTRGQNALSVPPQDHRYRAAPLYRTTTRVERLTGLPSPCRPAETVFTNNWTSDPVITDRYNKASIYNVGAGPLWEMIEDRSWWKESLTGIPDEGSEAFRRPRVYQDVAVDPNLAILNKTTAAEYLPKSSSSVIECFLGPFNQQTLHKIEIFESLRSSQIGLEPGSVVFNPGGPVWALDWCPIFVHDREHRSHKQYLAAAPYPEINYSPLVGDKRHRPEYSCIQIWSLFADSESSNDHKTFSSSCEMVLCIDSGVANDLKWCPLPANDPWESKLDQTRCRKLGILGGTFEDGSLSIYVVPDPDDCHIGVFNGPVFVKMHEPRLRIQLEDTSCFCLSWANSEQIAVGCTNGCVAVYNVKDSLLSCEDIEVLPLHYISLHQSAIRSVKWMYAPTVSPEGVVQLTSDPTVLASVGYDGVELLTDFRDGIGYAMNRTRDMVSALTYSPYNISFITVGNDHAAKSFSMSPATLGRGNHIIEAEGFIWSLDASNYHPQLAVGSADGSCMTVNTLKPLRPGHRAPSVTYKIFQIDYNRKTRQYRMLQNFVPKPAQERPTNVRKPRQDEDVADGSGGSGGWLPNVSVTRVVWNDGGGPSQSPLLASSTASGLCRVDWLIGRWLEDIVPYTGIDAIRKEVGTDIHTFKEDDDPYIVLC